MIYDKSRKNDSPYVSVNTLINPKPKKYNGINAFPPCATEEQKEQVLATNRPVSAMPPIFSGLKISKPGDPTELEADKLAEKIVGSTPSQQSNVNIVQRKLSQETMVDKTDIESKIKSVKNSGGQPLSEQTKEFFEGKMGQDLSKVRIHNDQKANESASVINAKAYTIGNDIAFGEGEYQPETKEGKSLLAHELAHVGQQIRETDSLIQRYVAPTDWLDYIGLGFDAIERIYIEIAYEEGEEKDFQRFTNTLFMIIDLVLAAIPGVGGGGLVFRGSRQLAIAGWGAIPDSIKIEITGKVAKELGWSITKATQMINRFFSVADKSGGGGKNNPKRKPWEVNRYDKVAYHPKFKNFYRDPKTGLWWSKDTAGHGGSTWKVFTETKTGLEWFKDADEFGDFIVNKYKGEVGKFIPWKELTIIK